MSFDVQRFAAEFGSVDGLHLNSKFRVRAFSPIGDSRTIEFLCSSFDVPGLTVATTPVRVLGYGAPVDAPLVPAYGETGLQCYVDNAGVVYDFFTRWQQAVVNFNYEPGGAAAGKANGAAPFQVSYAEDYVGRVVVDTFAQDGELSRSVTLHDAWPRSVGQVQHAWSNRDTITVLPVQLSYRSWTTEELESNSTA